MKIREVWFRSVNHNLKSLRNGEYNNSQTLISPTNLYNLYDSIYSYVLFLLNKTTECWNRF